MSTENMRSRISSAKLIGRAYLDNKKMLFNKRSVDGSAKSNLIDSFGDVTWGVLYEVDVQDMDTLDKIERGYKRISVQVRGSDGDIAKAETYVSSQLTSDPVAHDWYKELILTGSGEHDLPEEYIAYLRSLPSRPSP